jgi:hypothetical protein
MGGFNLSVGSYPAGSHPRGVRERGVLGGLEFSTRVLPRGVIPPPAPTPTRSFWITRLSSGYPRGVAEWWAPPSSHVARAMGWVRHRAEVFGLRCANLSVGVLSPA